VARADEAGGRPVPATGGPWRWLRWIGIAALLAVIVAFALVPPFRTVDLPLPELPVRLLDGGAVDEAWRAGRPLVIHVWLPG